MQPLAAVCTRNDALCTQYGAERNIAERGKSRVKLCLGVLVSRFLTPGGEYLVSIVIVVVTAAAVTVVVVVMIVVMLMLMVMIVAAAGAVLIVLMMMLVLLMVMLVVVLMLMLVLIMLVVMVVDVYKRQAPYSVATKTSACTLFFDKKRHKSCPSVVPEKIISFIRRGTPSV